MPRISVVVPVYKVERYLQKCVDSILSQTYKDFELILVDDGSPDNCPAICDEYAAKDKRVHVIHQKNGGLSAARNAGIDWVFANSDSEWITFIDSDDWVHPDMLHVLFTAAVSSATSVSVCGFLRSENENNKIHTHNSSHMLYNPQDFFLKNRVNAIVAWGKLYKLACFKNIRYPVGKLHEDEFVTYKILFSVDKISVIDSPLYHYRESPGSITNSWSVKRLDSVTAQYKQLLFFKKKKYFELLAIVTPSFLYCLLEYEKSISSKNLEYKVKKHAAKTIRYYFKKTIIHFKFFLPFKEYKFFYEYAFPKHMAMYWVIVSFLNKFSS